MSRRSSVRSPVRQEASKAPLISPPESNPAPVSLPLALAPLVALLAGSGCAALIYEIVWFQLLQLVIGASAVSLGLLLAFYMGGLCLGSVAFARFVSPSLDARRVYALIEAGIGAFGILALFGVPLAGRLYLVGPMQGLGGLIFRGVIAGMCLLPPALLMGGTFPAASRWAGQYQGAETSRVPWFGLLYAANTCGAVLGCVLAGFYLLRLHDLAVATYVAAAVNFSVACVAYLLPQSADLAQDAEPASASPPRRARGVSWIYVSIALSGFAALGAEVVWTRLLSLLLGATVYTFSIILAVFLTGLWAASSVTSLLMKRLREPRIALGACQILMGAACAWTAHAVAQSLPFWPVDPMLSIDPWTNFELDVIRCAFAILPAALLWGASFPLALQCAAAESEDPARLTGEVYAANTAGAIVGALLFSLALIPALGTAGAQQVLVWVGAAAGVAALTPLIGSKGGTEGGLKRFAIGGAAAVAIAGVASPFVIQIPWQVIAYGRRVAPILRAAHTGSIEGRLTPLFVGEGTNASVAIAQEGQGENDRIFYVSGKPEASSGRVDMRLQRMMGHLPALMDPNPRSVLVVGFGAGVTAGSFVPYPDVRKIVICELEPLIPPASGKFFAQQNNGIVNDPRTTIVDDDARHYILTSPEKFDVITTDPIHPWVKGTSALYSREYYELVKQHLNPSGVAAQWLPLYESDSETVRTELATFFSVFPSATVWSNFSDGDGYDMVLVGRSDDSANTPIDVDALDSRLKSPGYAGVAASLQDVGFPSAVDLLASYAGRAADLQPLLEGAQINEDLSMRLQYLAGMGVNSSEAAPLYRSILSYRRFPEGLFAGTAAQIEALHARLGRAVLTF